jgi:DNA-binding NtrC family response regulator
LGVIRSAVAEAPVLIVDDQEDFLVSLGRALDSKGIANVTAKSIEEAVKELRKRPRRVVIADVYLEDGNGLELLGEVDSDCSPPPLVLVTGHADWFVSDERGKQLGEIGVQCIEKPLDVPKLIATIDALRDSVT